jgi:PTS system fructose-specific IIC component
MFQEIQKQSRIHRCPCCARILYLPEGGTMLMGEGASRFGQGGLARFSSKKLIVPSLRADSRDEALEELIQALTREGWVDAPEQVCRAAIERENLITTAVESGLAFPHVRGFEGGGLIINLGLKRKGLRFGAPGNRLTRIIFFSVIPQAASGFYLRVMASLVKVFRGEATRKRLLDCADSEQVWETLLDITQEEFP